MPAKPHTRIALIGLGQVGSAAALSLLQANLASELLLVESNNALREAQLLDLQDVAHVLNSPTRVRSANYHEAGQCDIIVITAGSKHTPAFETNSRNISIVRNVVDACAPFNKDAVLIVCSNPVDLLTSLALEVSRLPEGQVIGAGTFLDSVRVRGLVAERVGIAANSIDVYAVGVQGRDEVVAWSCATVGGVPIDQSLESVESFGQEVRRQDLVDECRRRGELVVKEKGASPYGMGAVIANLCASIVLDKRNVRPVSHFQKEFGCCFSSLVVLGRKGVVKRIGMPLDEEEQARIVASAGKVKAQVDEIRKQI
ncbi:hypothetical protein OQA88_10971 [Cercophora sp. LCS_1]